MRLITSVILSLVVPGCLAAQDISLTSATILVSPGDAQSAGLRGTPGEASVTLKARDDEAKLVDVQFQPADPTALYRQLPPSDPCSSDDGKAFRLWPYLLAPAQRNTDVACIYKGTVTKCSGSGEPPPFEARIVHIDIDVDSDNTTDPIPNQKQPKPQPYPPVAGVMPDADKQDLLENPEGSSDRDQPGLLLIVNHGFDSTSYDPADPREDFQRPDVSTVNPADPDLSRGRIAIVAKKQGYLTVLYDQSRLRIYRNDGSAPQLIAPSTPIAIEPKELPILLEGVDPLGADGGTRIAVTFRDQDHQDPNSPAEDILKTTVVDLQLQVDRNRDGATTGIGKDLTDSRHRYAFWYNNDRDGDDTDDSPGSPDYDRGSIRNLRDLEDFQRMRIRSRGINDLLNRKKYSLALRWAPGATGHPRVKLFKNQELTGNADYTVEHEAAQTALDNADRIGEVKDEALTPVVAKWLRADGDALVVSALWDCIGDGTRTAHPENEQRSNPAKGALGAAVTLGASGTGRVVAFYRHLHLHLADMRTYYEHKTAGDTLTTADNFPMPTVTSAVDAAPDISADDAVAIRDRNLQLPGTDNVVLLVHGYRMQTWERRAFAETMYKRIWWQGYNGRFVFLSWPTEYVGDASFWNLWLPQVSKPQNYDRSEFQARRSGLVFTDTIRDIRNRLAGTPDHLILCAHSMGNIVLSEAMRAAGERLAGSYLAFQSAEISGCFVRNAPRIGVTVASSLVDSGDYTPDVYRFDAPRQPRSLVTWAQWNQRDLITRGKTQVLGPRHLNRDEVMSAGPDGDVLHAAVQVAVAQRITYYNGADPATAGVLIADQAAKPDVGFDYRAILHNAQPAAVPVYHDQWSVHRSVYLNEAPWSGLPTMPTPVRDGSGAILAGRLLAWNSHPADAAAMVPHAAVLAFVARAQTGAVGAVDGHDLVGQPGCPFTDVFDAQANCGFGDGTLDHSGEFNFSIQKDEQGHGPYPFWRNVLTRIGG